MILTLIAQFQFQFRHTVKKTQDLAKSSSLMFIGPIQLSKISKMLQEMHDRTRVWKSVFF